MITTNILDPNRSLILDCDDIPIMVSKMMEVYKEYLDGMMI